MIRLHTDFTWRRSAFETIIRNLDTRGALLMNGITCFSATILRATIRRASTILLASCCFASSTMAQTTPAPPTPSSPPAVALRVPNADSALERNKNHVLAFYDLMFNQSKPAQAMQLYGGATYTQHNPEVPDGRDAFVAFFEQMAKDLPGKSVHFKRVFAEGDYVTLHSEHRFPGWRGGSWAAMDIFRLDRDGKIVEHWDVLQKVPSRSANANGMF